MWGISEAFIGSKEYSAIQAHLLSMQSVPGKFLELIHFFKNTPDGLNYGILNLNDGRNFECYAQPHWLNGVNAERVWSFRDITQQVDLEKKLEYQATHDSLTSLYPQDGQHPEELLHHADLAMYHAKALGGNQLQFYSAL